MTAQNIKLTFILNLAFGVYTPTYIPLRSGAIALTFSVSLKLNKNMVFEN